MPKGTRLSETITLDFDQFQNKQGGTAIAPSGLTDDPFAEFLMELTTLNRIRVETALSRYPIHRLARKGNISIDLFNINHAGEADFKWEVTYNSKFGQPGPLAYKVDTLIVNRRIDECRHPVPEILKLGSLSSICHELGLADAGTNISDVKRALHQNASTYITAKILYKLKSGREKWVEIGYTRYSVVFTGDRLPDGRTADGVYIILNGSYRDLLNQVEVRPLDYDYLVKLAPGPQRFYELLSFQVYGALASGRPRAKMLYSDYCKFAPQTRYPDFGHMKKQMYKVHLPHRESNYIAKVDYQETTDAEGAIDWEMFYTPGAKAMAEYHAFTNRQTRHVLSALPPEPRVIERNKQSAQADLELSGADDPVFAEMIRRGIAEKKARALLSNLKPGQEVMEQLAYVDSLVARDRRRKLDNPPGLYVHYIRDNIVPPADFLSSRKARLPEQAWQAEHAERARQAQQEIEYDEYQAAEIQRYISEAMPQEEYQRIFAQRQQENRRLFKQIPAAQLDELTARSIADELKQSGRVPLLSFEEFCRKRSQSQSE